MAAAELLTRRFNALGIKQTELAARLGVDPATINRWLKGGSLPHPKIVPLLAEALDIDERELAQAIMAGQRDETRQARQAMAGANRRVEIVLAEMRQMALDNHRVVEENRAINDQIGRDIKDINRNFKEMTKALRLVNESLLRIVATLEAQQEDPRSF
jgi:transcriptional regulator with XRE-family HTH domain